MDTDQRTPPRKNWRAGARLCVGAVALGALATACSAPTASAERDGSTKNNQVVTVDQGKIRGASANGTNQFLGVPYAAPPIGNLRWSEPAPVAKWRGVRDSTTFGQSCAQNESVVGIQGESEDCLFLNVYTPDGRIRSGDKHPVVVWIHGGGFAFGEGQDYDPATLAADGTIVVTFNYRLGALGFLAHPALADGRRGTSGNYGLMDQQAALRWVKQNIRSFGGDPKNVTIAGESAGGLAVLAHLTSAGSRGLFDRAVVQSGAFALTQTPLVDAQTAGQEFATAAGCADQSAECLRGLPVAALLAANQDPNRWVPGVVDGKVLTQSVGTALASGKFHRVPIINGTNLDEERFFTAIAEWLFAAPTTAENYLPSIAAKVGVSPEVADVIAAEYPLSDYPDAAIAFSTMATDWRFACPALQVNAWTSKYVDTYAYEFNDVNAPSRFLAPVSFPLGAAHEAELQYLFGLPDPPTMFEGELSAEQQKLATSMKKYWSNFADHGNPGSVRQTRWPQFDQRTHRMLSFDTPRVQVQTDFAEKHNCEFWAQLG